MIKKILVVEDDEYIRDSMQELLEDEGYKVELAENGEDGINLLQKEKQKPDAILLDLMMPVKDGYQFLTEKQNDPQLNNIPVVVMSAYGNMRMAETQKGVNAYLKKPLDVDIVLQTLSNVIRN
jgi:CheY-like chemotaxis protein